MALKDIVKNFQEKRKRAAWEAAIEQDLTEINLLADIDEELRRLEIAINKDVVKLTTSKMTDLEMQTSRTNIESALCCVSALDQAKRNVKAASSDNDLFSIARGVVQTLNGVNKFSGSGVSFSSGRFSKAVKLMNDNNDERNDELMNLIPRIMESSELANMTDKLLGGATLQSCLKSDEAISIESSIQAGMVKSSGYGYAGGAGSITASDLKKKADDFTKK